MPNGRAWMTSEARQLHALRECGVPMKDIARVLGRSVDAVTAFNRDYGKYRRAPVKPLRSQPPSERLRVATMVAIAAFANDNGLKFDAAAQRLLMGEP